MKHLLPTLLLLTSFTFAQSSSEHFNFQGFHMIDGKPANGNFKVTFKVFDQSSGGNELWTSGPIDDLPLVNGVYQRALGQNNGAVWGAIDWSVGNKFIEVTIGDVAKERTQLMAVPIAIGANNSALLSGEPLSQVSPAGAVITWMTEIPPRGYLVCNGEAVSRTQYARLFEVLGTRYGHGDGSRTFNLPDMRGIFLRGWDQEAGQDPSAISRIDRGDGTTGNNVGTKQIDAFQGHWHASRGNHHSEKFNGFQTYTTDGTGSTWSDPNSGKIRAVDPITDNKNGEPRTSSETRPKNIYVMYCIKY